MWTSHTRNPPILPPFSAILEDGTDPDAVAKSLHKFVDYGKRNKDYCRLRSYGPKDYVQVPTKHLGYLKLGTPKFAASVEDFTDRSQNAARAVGKTEVICIYKCIQRTSEYISAFMDGLVEIPILKYQLFGRAAPFQDGSETRNIIKDGNTTTLPYTGIKKQDQSKESQKGIQSAIPSEPITSKRKWSTEGWEVLTSVSCGQLRGKCSTEGLEEVCSTSWGKPKEDGGPPDSPRSKGKWSTKGWGKASSANWGQSNGGNIPPDSIWTKRKRSDETRGGTSSSQWFGKSDTKVGPKESTTISMHG